MISLGQLVFDDDTTAASGIKRLNVTCESSNRYLGPYKFKVQTQLLSK